MATPILQLESLSKFYTSAQNVVVGLNSVNISFHRGEFVAITGESGSGKSTLAHILSGMLRYESGELYFNGRPTSHFDGGDWERYRRDNISFISQNYGILLSATVMENVVSALRLSGMEKKAAKEEAKTILQKVELWDLRRRRAAKLSSGQKQRLSIARALAKPAPILIADEPTGNLDPENSAMVISLLAEAAKDRLVLLITHDFSEAEECATRRISLQDGRITMDAQLRAPYEPDALIAPRERKKEALSFYISRLQLGGRPVWGSFVLLFFALTAFAVFAFLGTFIVNLDDANTRVYDGSAFPNGDRNRIVVQRLDGQPLTEEDFEKILSARYVESLEKYGFLTDINYFYIKDSHYRSAYTLVNVGSPVDPVYEQWEETEFLYYGLYARTLPLLANGTLLTAGREPENINEVVVAGDESHIGQSFRLHLQDTKRWSLSYSIYLDVTVVGVTDYGEGVYLHDDVGRVFTLSNMSAGWTFMPLAELSGNECILYRSMVKENEIGTERTFGKSLTLRIKGTHLIPCNQLTQVSRETFDKIIQPGYTTQASITIENYAYTGRVLQALQDMGYAAISPYQLGATRQVESLMIERLQTLIICAAVLVVVLVLQIIVLRALFGSEIENYRLLANIGLTCATAKRSIYWQILLFTALGQGVGFGALWYCNHIGIERIVSILRYLPPELMALLSAVHLAAALLAAAVIARAVRKRIYPLLQNTDDIRLDEEVAV